MNLNKYIALFCVLSSSAVLAASVRVASVAELSHPVEQSVPAKVITTAHPELSAQISAPIYQLLVQVGDRVEAGQPLIRLDCADYQLIHEQAQAHNLASSAKLKLSQQQYQRIKVLHAKKHVSTASFDKSLADKTSQEANLKSALAAQKKAQLNVSRCLIKAPFDGTITKRHVSAGGLAKQGMPLIRILSAEQPQLAAQLPQNLAASLKGAKKIYFATAQQPYEVKIRTLIPLIDSQTNNLEARLDFTADQTAKAVPFVGAIGRLIWHDDRLQIPAQYSIKRNQKIGLMLYEKGRAKFMPVADALLGQSLKVKLPLHAKIIIEGQHALNTGDQVQESLNVKTTTD